MTTTFAEAYGRGDFRLGGRHLIEASAGTGKTYSIQNVFARLLVEAAWRGEPWRVGEILVVTFTKAATQELRDRLRSVLEGLRRDLDALADAGTGEVARREAEENVKSRLGTGPAEWGDAEERGRRVRLARWAADDALREFDTASISTIHGFCERTRRRHAIETGADVRAELGKDDAEALGELCGAWVRTHLEEASRLGLTKEGLAETYAKALAERHDVRFDERPGDGAGAEAAGAKLRAAREVMEKLREGLKGRKTLSFNDLLLVLRETLAGGEGGEALKRALREDYKAVLIDEFQDTDPVQYGIFKAAFFGEGEGGVPVYFVGDPKQAIYAFRGGDVHTYELAKGELEEAGGEVYRLGRNYRACPKLVEAVNRLFGDGEGGASVFGGGIRYGGDLESDGEKTGLYVRGEEEKTPFHAVVLTGGNAHAAVLEEVADRVARLLNDGETTLDAEGKKGLRPGNIAVLVKSNDEAREMQRLLARRGVPGVAANEESVFASEEASDLLCVLEAVARTGGARRMRAALTTPLFGFGIHDLILVMKGGKAKRPAGFRAGLAEGDEGGEVDFEACQQFFADLRETWKAKGVMAALRRVDREGGVRMRVRKGDGERRLTNYQHLMECLHQAERDRHLAPEGLLGWLRKTIREGTEEEELELRLESDENAVQIMTVHKSKGLEFPVVFFAAQDGRAKVPEWGKTTNAWKSGGPLGFYHDGDGRLTVFSLEGATPGDGRNAAAEREIREEHVRNLYVALTRASKRCVMVAGWKVEGRGKTGPGEELAELLRRAGWSRENREGVWESGAFRVEARKVGAEVEDKGEKEVRWVGNAPASVAAEPPEAWKGEWKARFGASYSMLCAKPEGGAKDADAEGVDVDVGTAGGRTGEERSELPIFTRFRAGESVGTAFHELFEKISFQAGAAEREAAAARILQRHGLLPPEEGESRRTLAAATGMLEATLGLELEEPGGGRFRLRDVPDADRMAEWEFMYPLGRGIDMDAFGDVVRRHWAGDETKRVYLERLAGLKGRLEPSWMKGYVDLFFRHGGRYWVVDWKSNVLDGREESFSPGQLREEMARHLYFVQYLLYAAVVHGWLKRTLPGYSWERHFGGVGYVFVRGACIPGAGAERAVVADRPGEAMLDELGRVFGVSGEGG